MDEPVEEYADLFCKACFEEGILNAVQAARLWNLFQTKIKEATKEPRNEA